MQRSKSFFLELSVDAYVDHNYLVSLGFYFVYLLACGAQASISLQHFLQSWLIVKYEDDPDMGKWKTPWGSKMVGWPRNVTQEQAMAQAENLLKKLYHVVQGEAELLYTLMIDPLIKCECLRNEDPYDSHFQKRDLRANLNFLQLSRRPHAYLLDCKNCNKVPTDQNTFPMCQGCYRVRYCSRECQRADWKEHKKICKKKRAEWWGRAPVYSQKQRRELGLV
jgi:hypothetical protein